MEKFEYKTVMTHVDNTKYARSGKKEDMDKITILNENELNKLGQQGWELINTVAISIVAGVTSSLTLIFKRRI